MKLYDDNSFADDKTFHKGLQKQKMDQKCEKSGIVLKCDEDKIYTDSSDHHTLIFGNTGSKKTRNFCIPTIFSLGAAGESMIISDPKGEVYQCTSGYLQSQDYNIRVINYREANWSNFWNPLILPYWYYKNNESDRAIEMIIDLSQQLKGQVHSEKDVYWEQVATDLFIAIVLMIFEGAKCEKEVNFNSVQKVRNIIRVFDERDEQSQMFWDLAKTFKKDEIIYGKLAGIVAIKQVEKTLSCVLSVFDMMLKDICINQKITYMLSENEISYEELFSKKTALYLIVPDEKKTFHFLVSLFIKQSYEYMIFRAHQLGGILPNRINYILDEFSSLPKINDMSSMISAARSRNIRFIFIVQGMKQLQSIYQDDAETIRANCHNWIFLSSREIELLREISELCGSVYTERRGYRPLMSVSALQTLEVGREDSEALILRNNIPPYISWVKDFSYYPQAKYDAVDIIHLNHGLKEIKKLSVIEFLIERLQKELDSETDILDEEL